MAENSGKNEPEKIYLAIDLKSFYASVECRERNLDPLTTNLVVADQSRTEKTICLAVSPSLKSYGIPGRARLFEVIEKARQVNADRMRRAPGRTFSGKSVNDTELKVDPSLELDYVVATPHMAKYIKVSTEIYKIYMRYVAPEDVHVYSIDEVFIDATDYLRLYGLTSEEFARKMILDVLRETGITATAGIGTNLYLAKVAMDIEAKHIPADENGVRIAVLDEKTYRENLWNHRPLTDFWRVGRGIARKLEAADMHTMGDVALRSTWDEESLYRMFGINAELLIDHAWGYEPCTIADIKGYEPENNSIGSGQVIHCAYEFDKAKLVAREMTDQLILDLLEKKLAADQMVLTVCYDIENLTDPERKARYRGPVTTDRYGRQVPKEAHGSINLGRATSSAKIITDAVMELYDRIVDPSLLVRRIYVTANHVVAEESVKEPEYEQLDLFTDYEALAKKREAENAARQREKQAQQAMLDIRKRFGKNAILKGMNLEDGATMMDRNNQIGGHKA